MNTNATLTLMAYYYGDKGTKAPLSYTFYANFDNKADADAFVALFPKVSTLRSNSSGYVYMSGSSYLSSSYLSSSYLSSKSAVKRYKSIVRAAAKLGVRIDMAAPAANSYASQAAFEAALGLV